MFVDTEDWSSAPADSYYHYPGLIGFVFFRTRSFLAFAAGLLGLVGILALLHRLLWPTLARVIYPLQRVTRFRSPA